MLAEVAYLVLVLAYSLVLIGMCTFILSLAWYLATQKVPFVPSRKVSITHTHTLLEDDSYTSFLDIGSGTGSVLLSHTAPGAHVYGVEINPVLCAVTRLRMRTRGVSGDAYTIICGDMYTTPLPETDVVFVYLLPEQLVDIAKRLTHSHPGKILLSNRFPVEGWDVESEHDGIYRYTIPATAR